MLTPQDDLIGHQSPTTFDHVVTSDPSWMERLWYTGHPVPHGDVIFDIGLGYYPNRNVIDVFAGVEANGTQQNFRASRHARPNPLETSAGPLSIQVIEGLRRHRLVLAANESGLSFDLEFIASMNAHEETPHFRRRQGRVTEDMMRDKVTSVTLFGDATAPPGLVAMLQILATEAFGEIRASDGPGS